MQGGLAWNTPLALNGAIVGFAVLRPARTRFPDEEIAQVSVNYKRTNRLLRV